jgi:hypothetical protein
MLPDLAGHSASIRCMILSAKITASAMIECTAGDGLVLSDGPFTLNVGQGNALAYYEGIFP